MIIDLIKRLSIFTILVGTLSLTIAFIFGAQTSSIITTKTITTGFYTTQLQTIDLFKYTQNLSNAWIDIPIRFEDIIPPGQIIEAQGSFLTQEFWNSLTNNLIYIIQWLYFPINFLLWLIRWLVFTFRGLLAVIGISVMYTLTTDGKVYDSQIIQILDFIIENFQIPYPLENVIY